MKVVSFLLLIATLFFSCGKKGPLQPPPDTTTVIKEPEKRSKTLILPPKNLTFEILDNKGNVLLLFEGDWCEQFKVYRYKKDGKKVKIPYVVTSDNKFVDEFPLLNIPVIYEVSCVVKGEESQINPTVEVLFK